MKSSTRHAKIIALISLVSLPAISVMAAEYWMKGALAGGVVDKKATDPLAVNYWKDAEGVSPASIASDDTLYATSGTYSATLSKDHAGPFHAGAIDGSTFLTIDLRQNHTTLRDFRWHSAMIEQGYGGRMGHIWGKAYLDNPNAKHMIVNCSNQARSGTDLGCSLVCDNDEMTVTFDGRERSDVFYVISANNEEYLGNFSLSMSTAPLCLASANALGNPVTPRSDALSVDKANAVLTVQKGTSLNAKRGVKINSAGFRVRAKYFDNYETYYEDCTEFDLPMPIAGEYGFTKDGPGSVTMSGVYTAGDIVVSEGSLHIAESASFPEGQKISVAAGASLYVHQKIERFEITAEEGATVERILDTKTADFDVDSSTITPILLSEAYEVPEGIVQPIALSAAIPLPLHEGLRQEVMTVAAGAKDLAATDFVDNSPKTYGLPKTSFEVEKDEGGVQHVYLVARPVVVSVADFANDFGINGLANNWSNNDVPQLGFDYLIKHDVGDVRNTVFAGDSLTVATGVTLRFREIKHKLETANGGSVVVYPGVDTTQGFNGRDMTIAGSVYLPGNYGDSSTFKFHLKYGKTESYDGMLNLTAKLFGAGTLTVSGEKNGTSWNGITGDFTGWYGRLIMTGGDTTQEYKGVQVRVNNNKSFGGVLPEFKDDAVTMTGYAMIKAVADVSLDDERNRGLYVKGHGGFNVDEGKAFSYAWPLKVAGSVYKHGQGLLKMGGNLTPVAGSLTNLYVRQGSIAPLNDAAIAGFNVTFSNNTAIVISSAADVSIGFNGNFAVLPNLETSESGIVRVVPADDFTLDGKPEFLFALCTVPETAGDLSGAFAIEAPKGCVAELKKHSVTIDDVACCTYMVRITRPGMTMVIR